MSNESWRKPSRVTVREGYLIADSAGGRTYSLLDACEKGRALTALGAAVTDEQACGFTAAWGFLHSRIERGRWDRYPLSLFRAKRQRVLATSQLMSALGSNRGIREAVAALRDASTAVHQATYGATLPADPFRLTAPERALVEAGIPALVVRQCRNQMDVTLATLAAQVLAQELAVPYRLRILRTERRRWITKDAPEIDSLETAIRWTLRSGFDRWHFRLCVSCGAAWIAGRSDARFCSDTCSTRVRVRRFRRRNVD